MGDRSWHKVSRQSPCLVCEKTTWCLVSPDGERLLCNRADGKTIPAGWTIAGAADGGGTIFKRDCNGAAGDSLAHDPSIYVVTRPQPADTAPARDWDKLSRDYQQRAAGGPLDRLAGILKVPVPTLTAMGVGWTGHEWTFPSRNGSGEIIGLATRAPDGGKRAIRSSRMGLFYVPGQWSQGTGPVLVVEGSSDTLAMTSAGAAVVGRPSNTGGVSVLGEMLADWPADRAIIVVGEHDLKPDGQWPGRDGARKTAERLATLLYRDVLWSMPPAAVKDCRDWLAAGAGLEIITRSLLEAATTVAGKLRPPHEDGRPPSGEPMTLDAYRQELAAAKAEAFRRPGISLDRAGTGCGKTFSTIEELRKLRGNVGGERVKTATVLPTWANIRERAAEMVAAGIDPDDIGQMPELTPEVCENYDTAAAARDAGLSHGITVCPLCSFQSGCEWAFLAKRAKNRRHLLTTGEHYRRSWASKEMQKRSVVVIDEKPAETLAPIIECLPADLATAARFFGAVASESNALAARTFDQWQATADGAVEVAVMAVELERLAESLVQFAEECTTAGVESLPVAAAGKMPKGWQRSVHKLLGMGTVEAPPAVALRLVVALAEGHTDRAWCSTDVHADGGITRRVFVTWRTGLDGKVVVLLDGTGDPAQLSAMAGQPVRDITPAGHLPVEHDLRQRLFRISKRTASGTVRNIVTAVVEGLPQPRIGLIGHKKHIQAMTADAGENRLPATVLERIAMHSFFGAGPDRASNAWHRDCDVLVVAGTPRPNAGSIRRLLVAQGDAEAAAMPDGQWELTTWDAITTAGDFVTLEAHGFAHEKWRAAHQSIVRAGLLQAIGRARANLPNGIPCVVLSDEPLWLPVDMTPLVILTPQQRLVLDTIAEADRKMGNPGKAGRTLTVPGTKCQTGGRTYYKIINRPYHLVGTSFLARSRASIEGLIEMDHGNLSRALAGLRDAGQMHQPGDGLWALGPAPPGEVTYSVVGEDSTTRRLVSARELVERVAAYTPGNVASTADVLALEPGLSERSAKRRLSDAERAGEIYRIARGLYAANLPATAVNTEGSQATCLLAPTPGLGLPAGAMLMIEVSGDAGSLAPPPAAVPKPPSGGDHNAAPTS